MKGLWVDKISINNSLKFNLKNTKLPNVSTQKIFRFIWWFLWILLKGPHHYWVTSLHWLVTLNNMPVNRQYYPDRFSTENRKNMLLSQMEIR